MRSRTLISGLILVLLVFWLTPALTATDAELEFLVADTPLKEVSLARLQDSLESHRIRVLSSSIGKAKNYQAFALQDVLDFAYGPTWRSDLYSHIAFLALDGYEAVSESSVLQQPGGFLAFRDLDVESGWEPIGRKQAHPGPFFLVWTGKTQTTANGYPWPWQLRAINLVKFEDQFPAVVPTGADTRSSAYRGFEIFKTRCLRCHAINQQGGKVGPDLNAPQSVTAYRSKHMIKEMIKHPSTYRHSSMPDHPDLTNRDLEDLYSYLLFQATASRKSPE